MARSPTKKFRRIYWDACVWISVIQNETAALGADGNTENRAALARAVLGDAEKDAAEILTSSLSLGEVNKPSADPDGLAGSANQLAAFFENPFIVVVMLDRRIGEFARSLMQQGYPGLKPPDAIHIASAATANVEEMHTFDDKLLRLSGRIDRADGKPLKICKPSMGGPPLPLLETPPGTFAALCSSLHRQYICGGEHGVYYPGL